MSNDKFDRLRYIGYCWAKLPPDEEEIEFNDFVNYARFQLARNTNTLIKDPIWGEYTPEEILIEYYALLFHTNDEQADKFLHRLRGYDEDIYDWLDEQVKKNNEIREDQEGPVSFNPDSLGED